MSSENSDQPEGAAKVADDQHKAIEVVKPASDRFERTNHPDAQWFPEAGLGLFIHQGISSIDGDHDLSWAMLARIGWNPKPMLPEDYFALADRYRPDKHDPENWCKAAKEAGFAYAVLITRHHDGFANWPSRYGDYNTATRIDGRDLVRPFVDACRKVGLKVGFYYSPPDWWYLRKYMSFGYGNELPHLGLKHEPVQLPEKPAGFDKGYADYLNGQITELLTHYGKIDLFWFDGSVPGVMSIEEVRKLQPGIVVNDRQYGVGDFMTGHYEGDIPKSRPEGWWEHCYSMIGAWGYLKGEFCEPASLLVSRLVRCRTWGGNVLANFAPRPSGEMPDYFYKCMAEISDWMKVNGESLRGTQPGPYPEQCNTPATIKNSTWYIYLVPETRDGPAFEGAVVLTNIQKPKSVTSLATGRSLPFMFNENELTVCMPSELRTRNVDVIKVSWTR